MAFLLLLHEKMRLKRKVNKLTLQQTRYGSRLDRMTKNISRVQKMYSSRMSQLEKQAQMAQSKFKSDLMQQMGIGTQGLNPMNFGGMGGTSIFAMNRYNQLASELGNDRKMDGANGQKIEIKGLANAGEIVQAYVMSGGNAPQVQDAEGKKKDNAYKIGNYEVTGEQLSLIQQGVYQIKTQESQQGYIANQLCAQQQSNISLWLEAAKAELEAEQDEALAPLEAEQTDMELEKESVETQLAYARERLQALEQACSQETKEAAPKFGLG